MAAKTPTQWQSWCHPSQARECKPGEQDLSALPLAGNPLDALSAIMLETVDSSEEGLSQKFHLIKNSLRSCP